MNSHSERLTRLLDRQERRPTKNRQYATVTRQRRQMARQATAAGSSPSPSSTTNNTEARTRSMDEKDGDEMNLIKSASRAHIWHWSEDHKSTQCIVSEDKLALCFHPHCSESAAACRGSQPFRRDGNYYYWEIHVLDKTYGTSVMFGLCNDRQQLHASDYCNLIGLDQNGWSLSHKGAVWHDAKQHQYTQPFPPNRPITIGLLYNTMRGELSYYMDGRCLGVAFSGLNQIEDDLYPCVGSTSKCTRMRLIGSYCGYVSLLERSCFTLLKSAHDKGKLLEYAKQCKLPRNLFIYLAQAADICGNQTFAMNANQRHHQLCNPKSNQRDEYYMSNIMTNIYNHTHFRQAPNS